MTSVDWKLGGGAPLRRVQFGASAALVSTDTRLRGDKVGELRLGNLRTVKVRALRLPAQPSADRITLLQRGRLEVVLRPNRRRFVVIVGLPRDADAAAQVEEQSLLDLLAVRLQGWLQASDLQEVMQTP